MLELEIGLIKGGELKFDQSFQQFHVKRKISAKSYFKRAFKI